MADRPSAKSERRWGRRPGRVGATGRRFHPDDAPAPEGVARITAFYGPEVLDLSTYQNGAHQDLQSAPPYLDPPPLQKAGNRCPAGRQQNGCRPRARQ